MARYPGAKWVGANPSNYSTGRITPKFIVIHIMSGTLEGTNAWFNNPAAQVSAHFGVGRNGEVVQYVDTEETAWAEAQLNGVSISVEHEGFSGQSLTPQQLSADKALFKWIAETHGIHLAMTYDQNSPTGGVIPHGKINEGPLSHPDCPGDPVIANIEALLRIMDAPPPSSVPVKPTSHPAPAPKPISKKPVPKPVAVTAKGKPKVVTVKRSLSLPTVSNTVTTKATAKELSPSLLVRLMTIILDWLGGALPLASTVK